MRVTFLIEAIRPGISIVADQGQMHMLPEVGSPSMGFGLPPDVERPVWDCGSVVLSEVSEHTKGRSMVEPNLV